MDTIPATLNSILETNTMLDEQSRAELVSLMLDIRAEFWGNYQPIAVKIQEHLIAGRTFGIVTLTSELPQLKTQIAQLEKHRPIESIRVGLQTIKTEGQRQATQGAVKAAQERLRVDTPETVTAWLSGRFGEILGGASGYQSIGGIKSVIQTREEMQQTPKLIVPTKLKLDDLLRWGGLPMGDTDGETIIVLARSGHGKTALALHLSMMVAMAGYPVAYNVVADASAYQIFERIVYHRAKLPLKAKMPLNALLAKRIMRYDQSEEVTERPAESVRDRLAFAEAWARTLPIEINDTPNVTQHGVRLRLHHAKTRGVKFSVWDNLDHLLWDSSERKLDRREQLGELVKLIREFDRANGHHSLILAQANRASLENPDELPLPHNTQDSDQPKNHATLVIGLTNPNVDHSHNNGMEDILCGVGKNRSGSTGRFKISPSLVNPVA